MLVFPGLFRGALDVRARTVNTEMMIAAAKGIAGYVSEEELSRDYIKFPRPYNFCRLKSPSGGICRYRFFQSAADLNRKWNPNKIKIFYRYAADRTDGKSRAGDIFVKLSKTVLQIRLAGAIIA